MKFVTFKLVNNHAQAVKIIPEDVSAVYSAEFRSLLKERSFFPDIYGDAVDSTKILMKNKVTFHVAELVLDVERALLEAS